MRARGLRQTPHNSAPGCAARRGRPAAGLSVGSRAHDARARARESAKSPGGARIERHLAEARLPPGKTLDNFDFLAVPMISKAHVMALASGDTWLSKVCSDPAAAARATPLRSSAAR
jgi:hypothetical protein